MRPPDAASIPGSGFFLEISAFPIFGVDFLRFHKMQIDSEGHALQAARRSGTAQPTHGDGGGWFCAALHGFPRNLCPGLHSRASHCRSSFLSTLHRQTSQRQTNQRKTSQHQTSQHRASQHRASQSQTSQSQTSQ